MIPEFKAFPKIARLSRLVCVTEKIDGSNASIYIDAEGTFLTGSRNRWITPEDDNYGFSRWAHSHKDELMKLGPGHHFGEWWGSGVQRGYGLINGDKRFSLFNTVRWCLAGTEPKTLPTQDPRVTKTQEVLPSCVGLVPVLWEGNFDDLDADLIVARLALDGSKAVPGYTSPEGIVVFHTAAMTAFKKTIDRDSEPKGKQS